MSDYQIYRGKCKEMSEDLIRKDPSLSLVRGIYWCPIWGNQTHWWCKDSKGRIIDPSCKQFPSKGMGEYHEFDGTVTCAHCEVSIKEEEIACTEGRYAYCSYECRLRHVGLL
jgi:hypothetical protein